MKIEYNLPPLTEKEYELIYGDGLTYKLPPPGAYKAAPSADKMPPPQPFNSIYNRDPLYFLFHKVPK